MEKKVAERRLSEFRSTDPWDYAAPEDEVQLLDLPARLFAWVDGSGDPNGPEFAGAIGALYGLSYAARMSYRSGNPPPGWGAYAVGVLQGQWDIASGDSMFDPRRKDRLVWRVMIRQPPFLRPELFERFRAEAREKAVKKGDIDPAWFDRLELGMTDAGRFAQILHRGPYADEAATFARLDSCMAAKGLKRASKTHREIYLSDPRRTAPERMKTILRVALA